jgi:beta-mannosidase
MISNIKEKLISFLGDVHYYNYNMDTWNQENYPITRFLSETGVESMPSIETWQEITNSSEDWNFTSTLVQNREHHGNGQQEMMFVYEILFFFLFSYD